MSRPPRLPLAHEYHDGVLVGIELGPRREVVLHVRLDPVWNAGQGHVQRLHLSAIQNFDDVAAFFRRAPSLGDPGAEVPLDEVLAIVQPAKRVVGVAFDRLGYVEDHGAKVREP